MPVEVIGAVDRKMQGRLQTGSPMEKFDMTPHDSIALDLGQAPCYTALAVLERPFRLLCAAGHLPRLAFYLPECRLPADRTRN